MVRHSPEKRSISMKDVAALAGVSVGTVSNVLNSSARVSESTTKRVLAAIDQLGWVPNESARQLRTGYSQAIGLVVLDVANPFFADVVLGAENVLYGHGYSVYIGNSDQQPEREERLLRQFEQQKVRGVLLASVGSAVEAAARLRRSGIPVVMVDRARENDSCAVGCDDVEGGRLAVSHLIDMGHRNIAFVGGPLSLTQVRDRRIGAETALAELGDAYQLLLMPTSAMASRPGVAAAAEIAALPKDQRPTAVFAANDLLAIGLLQGFVAAGLRVPDDIALIGYDDIEFAASSAVPLSSVHQPRTEIGERAATLLIDEIREISEGKPHVHESVRLAPVLVPRASTVIET